MIIDRFIKYMEFKGLNDNKVTVDCRLSVGLLGKARKGKSDLGRNSIEKILRRYPDLSREWLLTGEGEMLLPPKNEFSQIPPEEIGRIVSESFTEYLLELYQKGEIYPAAVVKKMIAEKDEKIAQLQRRVWELENN